MQNNGPTSTIVKKKKSKNTVWERAFTFTEISEHFSYLAIKFC